jgi:hypothetical protein
MIRIENCKFVSGSEAMEVWNERMASLRKLRSVRQIRALVGEPPQGIVMWDTWRPRKLSRQKPKRM